MRMPEYEKVYVAMLVHVDENGNFKPARLIWEDGRWFDVDRVLDARMCPPDHVGAYLTKRFECEFAGGVKKIFYEIETNRWFVEKLK